MKILFTGGGTMGSVSPLIAVYQQLNSKSENRSLRDESLWLGTKLGPEKEIVEKEGIRFKAIAAGKLRRYFDLRNIIDLFKIKFGFWQAFLIILKFKPDIILSAGSFVSVPVVWAGWLLRVPSVIHQQDIQPGLANKLMAPFAARITVALEVSLEDYPSKKAVLAGNPVRQNPKLENQNLKKYFKNDLPILLVVGGGTGALGINELVWQSLAELTKFCNIIHIAGKGKMLNDKLQTLNAGVYRPFEFLHNEIYGVIQAADVVVSRAGMSTLTELAYFSKPAIVLPIPNSHQEKNAEYFAKKNACIYLKQNELSNREFISKVRDLLRDKAEREKLGKNIHKIFIDYSGEKILQVILALGKRN